MRIYAIVRCVQTIHFLLYYMDSKVAYTATDTDSCITVKVLWCSHGKISLVLTMNKKTPTMSMNSKHIYNCKINYFCTRILRRWHVFYAFLPWDTELPRPSILEPCVIYISKSTVRTCRRTSFHISIPQHQSFKRFATPSCSSVNRCRSIVSSHRNIVVSAILTPILTDPSYMVDICTNVPSNYICTECGPIISALSETLCHIIKTKQTVYFILNQMAQWFNLALREI